MPLGRAAGQIIGESVQQHAPKLALRGILLPRKSPLFHRRTPLIFEYNDETEIFNAPANSDIETPETRRYAETARTTLKQKSSMRTTVFQNVKL